MNKKIINIIVFIAVVFILLLLVQEFMGDRILSEKNKVDILDSHKVALDIIADTRGIEPPMWIMFSSKTCPACVTMKEYFEELEPEYQGRVSFIIIDVGNEENWELARQFGVQYIPATYMFNQSAELTYEQAGIISKAELREGLDRLVSD